MCEWEWVPISATTWDRWIVASARHLPSAGSTGMLNVAAGSVVYSLNRSIDLHMKIHLQQSFESLGTGPRSECPHHFALNILWNIYTEQRPSFTYALDVPSHIISGFTHFCHLSSYHSHSGLCVFSHIPRPWIKGFQFKTAWWIPLSTFRTRPQPFLSSLASVIPDVAYSRLQGYIRILLPSVPDEFRWFFL